jgi:hypothetical protein
VAALAFGSANELADFLRQNEPIAAKDDSFRAIQQLWQR